MLASLIALLAVVSAPYTPSVYACDGVTAAFTVNFPYLAKTDVTATSTTAAGVATILSTSAYNLSVTSASVSATLTLNVPATSCPSGSTLTIARNEALTQPTSFRAQTTFNPALHEQAFDRLEMQIQQLNIAIPSLSSGQLLSGGILPAGSPGQFLSPSATSATGLAWVAGASAGSFTANGTGAVVRTISDKLSDVVSVKDFGASPSASAATNNTAFQGALAAVSTGGTVLIPPGIYSYTSQLTLSTANVRISGYGAKLVQSGTLQRGITMTGAGDVLEGVWIFNTHGNTEYADAPSGSTNAIGVYLDTGCDGCKVLNARVEQFGYAQIRVHSSAGVTIDGCELIGIGLTKPLVAGQNNNIGIEGYLSGALSPGLTVTKCNIHDLAQGLVTSFDWSNFSLLANYIHDIQGQHGCYSDNCRNCSWIGNRVARTGQNGLKLQISADATFDSENDVFSGNVIDSPTGAGIIALPATGGLTPRFKQLVLTGNAVVGAGASCYSVDQADNWLVTSNSCRNSTTFGIISGTASGNGRIALNHVQTSQQTGIYSQASSTSFITAIEENTLDGVCALGSGTSDTRAVIYVGSGKAVVGNNIFLADTNCSSDLNINTGAIAVLRRQANPGTKNNVSTGTITSEGLTTNTVGSNGATVTANVNTTLHLFETVPFATWTVGLPTNLDSYSQITYTVSNTSGGATVTTWPAAMHLAGSWVDAATGFNRSITFRRNNNTWYEVSRTAADAAN